MMLAAGLLLAAAVPAFAATGDAGELMIMKHACTEEPVKNQADFDAIVAQASGDEITALALTVGEIRVCPVTSPVGLMPPALLGTEESSVTAPFCHTNARVPIVGLVAVRATCPASLMSDACALTLPTGPRSVTEYGPD